MKFQKNVPKEPGDTTISSDIMSIELNCGKRSLLGLQSLMISVKEFNIKRIPDASWEHQTLRTVWRNLIKINPLYWLMMILQYLPKINPMY